MFFYLTRHIYGIIKFYLWYIKIKINFYSWIWTFPIHFNLHLTTFIFFECKVYEKSENERENFEFFYKFIWCSVSPLMQWRTKSIWDSTLFVFSYTLGEYNLKQPLKQLIQKKSPYSKFRLNIDCYKNKWFIKKFFQVSQSP